MSIRILHAADLHLDSPFEGLSGEKAALRRSEQRRLVQSIADTAQSRGAQLLLLSGDILDSENTYAETGETLLSALSGLSIPIFIAPGNHDWVSRRSPYSRLRFPENVHIFRTPVLECVPVPSLGVRVWGAGYTSRSCPPLLRGFSVGDKESWQDVLVLHAEVGRSDSPYCPVTEQELAASGLDYAALGHIHTYSGLRTAGQCHYAWPGCPEGRGFDECGKKGILQVDLYPHGCRGEFIPMDGREYRVLSVRAGENALTSIQQSLPEDTKKHIYRITLTGECISAPDLAYLREALEERFFSLTLQDETVPRRDIWERASEDSLTGAFLRGMRDRLHAAENEEQRALIYEAVRLGMAAWKGGRCGCDHTSNDRRLRHIAA